MKLTMSLITAVDVFMLQENIKDLVTDPNHLLWNRGLLQGKTFTPGFIMLPVTKISELILAWLFCSALPFVLLNGTARCTQHKREEHRCRVLVGPGPLHNPSSYCSTFHSDYLFIDCMTKTCHQIKYRWEDSLDNEIAHETLAAELWEIAPRNS